MNQVMHEHHQESIDRSMLGFWVYLMTDLLSFAVLFATYAVLYDHTAGGPAGKDLFHLPFVLTQSIILLTSSFTAGLALLALRRMDKNQMLGWLAVTFLLGATFLGTEIYEFSKLISHDASWMRSASLSAFFALVGTHGLHIAVGLVWMAISSVMTYKRGLTPFTSSKLVRLIIFWHFLDVVWIFIFTIVYLMAFTTF